MPKSRPPLPPTPGPWPCTTQLLWHQLPTDKRQPCHERMAHLLLHVSHRVPREAGQHEHQDEADASPTRRL